MDWITVAGGTSPPGRWSKADIRVRWKSAAVIDQNYPVEFLDFVEGLYSADTFDAAFSVFEAHVLKLGFDGVLYTYIPQILLDSNFSKKPVYEVSIDYCPGFLNHYVEARFDKLDPLIRAVDDGVSVPINWWGDICADYMDQVPASESVLATASHYGIRNGLTLPLMSGARGIAGASFISHERIGFDKLLDERIKHLILSTKLFHSMVVSEAGYAANFAQPLLQSLSETERKFVIGLAHGKTTKELSAQLNRSNKYLEQVMISTRKKLSGNPERKDEIISRNQLLYYAGLLNILEEG